MNEPDLSDIRATEIVLKALHPLKPAEQVRVLRWAIDKLELALDMKISLRNASSTSNRSYIDIAHERALFGLDSPSEFFAEARPKSIVDRVLVMAVCLHLKSGQPDGVLLHARDINIHLRSMGRFVPNVTDCLNTLMKRTPPPHVSRHPLPEDTSTKYGYRVTEAGIQYVFKMIALREDNEKA